MPFYSNVAMRATSGAYYKDGGKLYRRIRPKVKGHMESILYVGTGFARYIGSMDFDGDRVYDDFFIQCLDYGGPTFSMGSRGKLHGLYGTICMDLYTVSAYADPEKRKERVLCRKVDVDKIDVIEGGGYFKGRRTRDNIILKVRCSYRRFIVIQRDNTRRKLRDGDILFVVSKEGVKKIILTKENRNDIMSEYDLNPWCGAWQPI